MGVFGDGLGTLRDGVLSELTWEEELDGRLDRSSRHGSSSGNSDESGGFGAESVEGIVHERVHDIHGSSGDSNIWVDLFEDFVDVDGKRFLPLGSLLLLVSRRSGLFDSFF